MEVSAYSEVRDPEYDYINPAEISHVQINQPTVPGYLTFSPGGPGPKSESLAASVLDYETPRAPDPEYTSLQTSAPLYGNPRASALQYESLQVSEKRNTEATPFKCTPAKVALAVAVAVAVIGAGVGVGWYWATYHLTVINECVTGDFICPTGCKCVDEKEGYSCINLSGFLYNNGTCPDIDECKEEIDACAPHQCVNTPGSYECACRKGYRKTDKGCETVNECTDGEAVCAFGSECVDTEDGYTCECQPGYFFNREFISCDDINECDNPEQCEYGCVNVEGSFKCLCRPGYEPNQSTNKCEDIDECSSSPCTQTCTNTVGSYECVCDQGYVLISDKCIEFKLESTGPLTQRVSPGGQAVLTCKVMVNLPMKVYTDIGDPEVPALGWVDPQGLKIPNEIIPKHDRYTAIHPVDTNGQQTEWTSTLTIDDVQTEDAGDFQCTLYHRQDKWSLTFPLIVT